MPRKGGAQKMKKLVFSVLTVLITVLILAGCEKAPAPATDPVPTPQESLSSEESQSSSVYVKEPQTTVFDGRSYTCTGYNTYTDDETGDCYYFYDIFASADEKSAEPNAAVIKIIVNYSKKPTRYVAVIRQNGEIKEWFEIKDLEIRSLPESDEIAPPEITFDESAKILTAKTGEHPTYNVLVNFEKQSAEAWFSDIKEEYLEFTEKVSPNGKYSLYEGAFHGGGDVGYWALFLKNNQTGEIRYFRETGGMYGGYSFCGFLKNGDLYYMSSDSLKIYNPDTLEKTFDLGKSFDLVYREGEPWRLLFTFRRDPVNMDFIIVYSDISEDSLDWENSPSKKFTYRVGFLDKDGNLLESYDTGEFVRYGKFHVADVSLKLDGDILHMYYGWDSRGTYASGTFNIKTHEYKRD